MLFWLWAVAKGLFYKMRLQTLDLGGLAVAGICKTGCLRTFQIPNGHPSDGKGQGPGDGHGPFHRDQVEVVAKGGDGGHHAEKADVEHQAVFSF